MSWTFVLFACLCLWFRQFDYFTANVSCVLGYIVRQVCQEKDRFSGNGLYFDGQLDVYYKGSKNINCLNCETKP